jgi:hypothetical protein
MASDADRGLRTLLLDPAAYFEGTEPKSTVAPAAGIVVNRYLSKTAVIRLTLARWVPEPSAISLAGSNRNHRFSASNHSSLSWRTVTTGTSDILTTFSVTLPSK